jgi:hypothetical protein
LPTVFVKHYHRRDDNVLPTVGAITTLPLVLPDGTLLATNGLDRERGVVFRIAEHLRAILPIREQCTPDAIRRAFNFLSNEWLVDVATDPIGKCIAIADALTLIERILLPSRPVFILTAPRRGSGKTTLLNMLLMAITGVRPPAAAWSENREERRKALLAYLLTGVPAIVWDNIPRGTKISCPFIEQSCTTAFHSDRILGVTQIGTATASAIHQFTGNAISARGELASRALRLMLEIDRHDPENRPFMHPDPLGWTLANRPKILEALYTLLLGNPALWPSNVAPRTRFKEWWQLVGSAVEHAADLCDLELDFQSLFIGQEEEDEDSTSLADVLRVLVEKWPNCYSFAASDVARLINDRERSPTRTTRNAASPSVTSSSPNWRTRPTRRSPPNRWAND